MASLRERNRSRTKADIERAALELFERQGYDATTVDQIARGAGVSSATFFRYFGSKEEVLFVNEDGAVDEMVNLVAARQVRSATLAALAEPVAVFAKSFIDDNTSDTSEAQRLTRLVMTTRELESRSMRMRLRWEHAIARQLANERGSEVTGTDALLANLAVACLTTALWRWQAQREPTDLSATTRQVFAEAATLID